ncbi:PepSY domain-containing protein [Mucilaginibacter sp. JRF]|uniref:PepSY-associated TM helix domain-containing protein n=1 Tax=Mucilaginibacter sp. JRF TaxID=2780088 RepID=UPI001880A54D|nr:PepSY-associated TM helix domain-containing protein [Mucilaginibacter sp. JRF]MBE9586436.1 PepSY domain-containing protein [Mucilaginibacter sp. JRF]
MMFKKINAWVHLWFGLFSGIVVFVLGLTGCILVFEPELRSLTSPWLHVDAAGREMLPPSVLYQTAKKALPDKKLGTVWYHGEDHSVSISVRPDSQIYVNPYTAKVVAIKGDSEFFDFVKEGHYYLWLPEKIGHQVTGWGTAIFFILLVSGLVLWWPKKWNKRAVEQSFKVKWKAKFKRVNYDLHNVFGFYSLLVALVLAFTGLMMSFRWFGDVVFILTGGVEHERVEVRSDSVNVELANQYRQVDKAWRIGITQIGEHDKKSIIVGIPEKASDPIYLTVDMYKGTWRDVALDQATLKPIPGGGNGRMRDLALADWINRANYGLHVGEIGGITTKIIYFIASLISASLPITGFLIWWGRRKKKSAPKVKNRRQLASVG